jgi:hypothetical protein
MRSYLYTPCQLPTISFMCQFYLHGIGNVYQGFLLIWMVQEWDATKTELMVRCSGRHKLSNCAWFKLNLCVSNQGPNWNFFLLSYPSITRKLVEDLVPSELNNRKVLSVPLPKPEDEFDLLIGDWNSQSHAQGNLPHHLN